MWAIIAKHMVFQDVMCVWLKSGNNLPAINRPALAGVRGAGEESGRRKWRQHTWEWSDFSEPLSIRSTMEAFSSWITLAVHADHSRNVFACWSTEFLFASNHARLGRAHATSTLYCCSDERESGFRTLQRISRLLHWKHVPAISSRPTAANTQRTTHHTKPLHEQTTYTHGIPHGTHGGAADVDGTVDGARVPNLFLVDTFLQVSVTHLLLYPLGCKV